MSRYQRSIWNRLINEPRSDYVLRTAMWRVACGLSSVAGHQIKNEGFEVQTIPFEHVIERAGSPEMEMVGIYLLLEDELHGQAIMILPLTSALKLVDWLMGDPLGTASELGELECSALAEVGNVAVSRFLNAVAVHTGWSRLLRPSPPGVMVDMLGAVLDIVVAQVAAVRDDLLIIETVFRDDKKDVQARFWVVPDPEVKALVAGNGRGRR